MGTVTEPLAERKQVSVLFCDVADSLALAGRLDPEAWRAILTEFLEIFREEIERHGGTVDKFTGDGAMAIFGAPVAQEDHAVRICRTALRLRERFERFAAGLKEREGFTFAVRTGINSGEVVVGSVEASGGSYTAIGPVVGIASRLESIAAPGGICLSNDTARLINGLFETRKEMPVEVKGVTNPIEVHSLVAENDSGSRRRSVSAALVSRTRELAALESALEDSRTRGQLVVVEGDVGMGKSRLCAEFAEISRHRGVRVTEGRGFPGGSEVPLWPVRELLRSWFGLEESDAPDVVRSRILSGLGQDWDEVDDAVPVLQDFLGSPRPAEDLRRTINPEERQRLLFAVIRRILTGPAKTEVGVLIIEDLHWFDPGSEDLLSQVLELLPASRTLVVVNFRTGYRGDWSRGRNFRRLILEPFSEDESHVFFERLVGSDESLRGLSSLIWEKTGGNPLFVEEVVQTMLDEGALAGDQDSYRLTRPVGQIEIPATVQAVLAARIDRLPAADKEVLGSAAVIGQRFSRPVLDAITIRDGKQLDRSLSSLEAADLIFRPALAGAQEFEFEHGLVQEVAYSSQLRERRVELHRRVADAIEALAPERADESAALVAYHREGADQHAEAVVSLARAATWAGQHHPDEAIRHWRRIRWLIRSIDRTSEIDQIAMQGCLWTLQFGWRLGLGEDELEDVAAEGLRLADNSGEPAAKVVMLGAVSLARGMLGNLEVALEKSYEGVALARKYGLRRQLQPATPTWYWNAAAGNLELALEEIDEFLAENADSFEIGRNMVGFSLPIFLTYFRGQILCDMGRITEAESSFRRALKLAGENDELESLGWAHSCLAAIEWYGGELGEEAIEHGLLGVATGERLGSPFSTVTSLWLLSLAHSARGEWSEAIEAAEASRGRMNGTGTGTQYAGMASMALAEGRLGAGDVWGALRAARGGVAAAVKRRAKVSVARSRVTLGRVLLAAGDYTECRGQLRMAIELGSGVERATTPRAYETLADLAGVHGDAEEQLRFLELALQGYSSGGATTHRRRVEMALARLRTESGRP